ncbi:MAG TPA: alcohol dehydrogenase catalytic domain-containing protein [Thermoanaerobaculia bacterium]|nr:alcohol dehydrogenase catalytic domain-containing protein [Thermoanaerobaculia bacterium]
MKGAWLEDRRLVFRDDLPSPVPTNGEALVRVLLAGICNTDIELTHGYYPYAGIPGHEFVGEFERKRVVGEINASCGTCAACMHGRRTHCERRTVLGIKDRNGAFAEYLTLPFENLHVVPDGVPNEVAVFTEPLAAALEIQQQVEITDGDRVLVVGHGKLGRLIAASLALTGCNLTVVGREHGGIAPRSFDVVVECSGNAEGFALARQAVRPRGTIVMKSTYAGDLTFNASSLVVDEITLLGSRCGPFAPALELLASGKIDPRPMIHARYPLREVNAAFAHAEQRGALKVLLTLSS